MKHTIGKTWGIYWGALFAWAIPLQAVEITIDGRLANSTEASDLEWGDNSERGDSGTTGSVPVGSNRPDPVSDDDGTIVLTVTANIQDWRKQYSSGEYDPGEEWNVRSSHTGVTAEAAINNEAYISIVLDSTSNAFDFFDWDTVSISFWRNGGGADNMFQLAVDANGDGFDVGDLVGDATDVPAGIGGATTLSLESSDLPKGTTLGEVRLYHWGNGSPSGNMHFYDVVAEYTPVSSPGLDLGITLNGDGLEFTWPSSGGFQYDLRSSADLMGEPATWDIYDDGISTYEDIPSSGSGTNTLSGVQFDGDKRFFAIVREPAEPLLSADFEVDGGNFTFNTVQGSDWEFGTPDTSSAGGVITEGDGGSSGCWATVLGSASANPGTTVPAELGYYLPSTESVLSTPIINLTNTTTPVTLSFSEALDIFSDATAQVFVVDSDTNTDIGGAIYTAVDSDFGSAPWAEVSPIELPVEALGSMIRIEFRFLAGMESDFAGWYIDNVKVEN